MSYDQVFLTWFVMYLMSGISTGYIAYTLIGEKTPYWRFILRLFPYLLLVSSLSTALITLSFLYSSITNYSYFIIIACELLLYLVWFGFLFRGMERTEKFYFASMAFSFWIMEMCLSSILTAIWQDSYLKLPIPYEVTSCFQSMALTMLSVKLLSKTKMWGYLRTLIRYPRIYIPAGIFFFLFYYVYGFIGSLSLTHTIYLIVFGFVYFILLFVIVFLAGDFKNRESLAASRTLLLQQQNYIQKMEALQSELRSIQHDYKNMVAGLYAQASEGNTEAVKDYIDTKLLKIDKAVRDDIQQMNQLTQIGIPELKGLILTKMLEAERDKITFRLEAMFSVNQTFMETEDLLRCIGILLDNAIEEARKQKDVAVTLLMLQEDSKLTIVVKNPVQDRPDLTKIRQKGYSTKGPGRGIGLPTYTNIIRKYPNAMQETKIEGDNFLQILILMEISISLPKKTFF